jgi:hypothetical protein
VEENQDRPPRRDNEVVYSQRVKAGRRRTYFFDVRMTRGNDYYLTITESKKRPDESYEKHKVFLYKEDFNKFLAGLNDVVGHVKTELLPDFNFDQFDHREPYNNNEQGGEPNYNRGDFGTNYDNQSSYNQGGDNVESAPVENSENVQETPAPKNDNDNSSSGEEDLKW